MIYQRIENPTPRVARVTTTGSEPVTLSELKTHLRIDGSDEDTYLTTLITVARQRVETITGRVIVQDTYAVYFDYWGSFNLDLTPVQSVTAINYYDEDDTESTWASSNYYLQATSKNRLAHVYAREDSDIPSDDLRIVDGIKVTVVAGYVDDNVPENIKQAILITAASMYENRGDCPVDGIPPLAKQVLSEFTILRCF